MIREIREKAGNQRGFTLVELMVVIAILGILAAVAVPRFAESTTLANTSRVAADLRTIDSAIAMHLASNPGEDPSAPSGETGSNLVPEYLAVWPVPPTGKIYINGVSGDMPAAAYSITDGRATLDDNTSEAFHK